MKAIIVRHVSNSHPLLSILLLIDTRDLIAEVHLNNLDNDALGIDAGALAHFNEALIMKDYEKNSKFSNLFFFSFLELFNFAREEF